MTGYCLTDGVTIMLLPCEAAMAFSGFFLHVCEDFIGENDKCS